MPQDTSQFTPAQILAAGQRSETDGRLQNAIQFYRYLVEQHPGAVETQAAREALARLSLERVANGGPDRSAAGPVDTRSTTGPPPPASGADDLPRTLRRAQAAAEARARGDVDAERKRRPRSRFLAGRVVAGIMSVVGGLAALWGCVRAGIASAAPSELADVLSLLPGQLSAAAMTMPAELLIVGGLLAVLAGQLASAAFLAVRSRG
ncbi:MAG: hypothetical protein AAFQ45_05270 [Pseudomonadota bacterium]